ncbi:MAG TPA: DUF742 domain-containing protein [Micromonosporaceae bacterium]|jgi:hypothetical protein
MTAPERPDPEWVDEDAGPVVRHYAMTSGRTRPRRGEFDLITLIMATRTLAQVDAGLQPELSAIVRLAQSPVSVAELATRMDLPTGTVRVLLGDLLDRGYIRTRSPAPAAQLPTERVFKAVLDGLRSL